MIAPYYTRGNLILYLGDCREVLPLLPVGHLARVGTIVADPPYGDTSLPWDFWPSGWTEIVAAAVPTAASLWCFGSMRMLLKYGPLLHADWLYAQDLVWEKHNGSSLSADRFRRVHEHVVQWYRGLWGDVYKNPITTNDAVARTVRRKQRPAHWGNIGAAHFTSEDGGPRLQRSVLYFRSAHGEAEHPTEKPVSLIDVLLRYSLAPGRTVLDPFAGSGTTLVAAQRLGQAAIGIESQERYCEIAAKRIQKELL